MRGGGSDFGRSRAGPRAPRAQRVSVSERVVEEPRLRRAVLALILLLPLERK